MVPRWVFFFFFIFRNAAKHLEANWCEVGRYILQIWPPHRLSVSLPPALSLSLSLSVSASLSFCL